MSNQTSDGIQGGGVTSEARSEIPSEVNGRKHFKIRFRLSPRGKEQVWGRFYITLADAEADAPKVLAAEFFGRARLISVSQAAAS